MKRLISLLLCVTILLPGCSNVSPVSQTSSTIPSKTESLTSDDTQVPTNLQFEGLDDASLQSYIKDTIYSNLAYSLDSDSCTVKDVSTKYVSKEYLEEAEYNSQDNIFFGYTLSELDKQFQGTRYVFTSDESGKTVVEKLDEIQNDTYDTLIKGVVIGTGIVLVCATVVINEKYPQTAKAVEKTAKLIFSLSSTGEKPGTIIALELEKLCGTIFEAVEGIRTGDSRKILESSFLVASKGFKFAEVIGLLE